jgi:hypothetical protein
MDERRLYRQTDRQIALLKNSIEAGILLGGNRDTVWYDADIHFKICSS